MLTLSLEMITKQTVHIHAIINCQKPNETTPPHNSILLQSEIYILLLFFHMEQELQEFQRFCKDYIKKVGTLADLIHRGSKAATCSLFDFP
ncbi:hypothetical protein ASL14_09085 [Paenibacillus sp. IHB B 3084]|nr:hypothetical protein ASL14_09085 [Paenibacillus sp. IHB B 3084]